MIHVDTYPDEPFAGKVTYISDVLDPQTRTAKIRCEVPNSKVLLKLDMFAIVQLPTTFSRQTLAVPVGAIQQLDGKTVVFVRRGATQFETREISVGKTGTARVEILLRTSDANLWRRRRVPPEVDHCGQGTGGRVTMERLVALGSLLPLHRHSSSRCWVAAAGLYSLQNLPIDAVPDITPNQVLVLTRAPSLSPLEVEKFRRFRWKPSMSGLPGIEKIQSVSKLVCPMWRCISRRTWTPTSAGG